MFSSKILLKKRTPANGTDRETFLSLLVDEYLNSSTYDAKCQVLANLANFAYDPINYLYIREVGVLDVFMYVLQNENNAKLLHFACAGICNLCIDPVNAAYIQNHMGLKTITDLLNSEHNEIVADTITTLIYLCNDQNRSELNTPTVVQTILKLKESDNNTLANLAMIYLKDVCNIN